MPTVIAVTTERKQSDKLYFTDMSGIQSDNVVSKYHLRDTLTHFTAIQKCCEIPLYESFETYLPENKAIAEIVYSGHAGK